MEELVSARIFFFSLASGAGNFFRSVFAFLSHSCCIIFFYCKGFAGNFFLKSSTPPPPPHLKYQMVHPLETSSVLCTSTWDFVLKGRISSFIEVPQQLRHIMQISGFYSREHARQLVLRSTFICTTFGHHLGFRRHGTMRLEFEIGDR